MVSKHRRDNGKHHTPHPLRTTGGLLAAVTLIGLAAGTLKIAGGIADDPSTQAVTLAALAPNAKAGVPGALKVDGKQSSARGFGAARKAMAKPETKPKAAVPGQAKTGAAKPKAVKPAPVETKPTAADAIELARKQVGIEEDAGGRTKFQKWYATTERAEETVGRDGGGSPEIYADAAWCSMFISWVGNRLGLSDQLGMDAWTVEHAKWFQRADRWGTKPKPGAIVFFDWSGSKSVSGIEHVGMVIKDKGDGQIETVEGNTSDAVRVRERSTSSVAGYGYPDYAAD